MLANFSFLDYVWRGLVVGTLTSTLVLLLMLAISWGLQKRITHLQMKWFFNHQLMLLLFVFAASFFWVAIGDPELAAGCFNRFAQDSSSFTITRIVAGSWLLIAIGFLGVDSLRVRWSFIMARNFRPIQDPRLKKQMSRLANHLGLVEAIGLYTTTERVSPFVWGFFNYKVILPEIAIKNLDPQTLENILAHELVHVRDRDSLWVLLEIICQRLMFFNPVVYCVGRKHLQVIEKAADEEAVKQARIPAQDLLQSLLAVISICKNQSRNAMSLNASRSFRELKDRMESLAQIERKTGSNKFFNGVLVGSFILSLGFSVAQARMAVSGLTEKTSVAGMMCSQVKHEKLIEAWLNMESAPRSVPHADQTSANKCQ